MRVWLCDCGSLRVEGDFVCGLEQVLPDCGHRQLGVGFADAKGAGAVSPKEALHGAEALLNPEPAFGNQFVEPFLRRAQRTITSRLSHDPVAVFATQTSVVGLACIGLVRQHPLCVCAVDHGFKLGALGLVGGDGVDLVHEAFFIRAGKRLIAQCESVGYSVYE